MTDDPNAPDPNAPEPNAPEGDPDAPEVGDPEEDGRYPAEIVQSLRREAADRRRKARDAEQTATTERERAERLSERLLASSLAQHATGLADPQELLLHVDRAELLDDDGIPDPAKITTVATALLVKKPHLGSRKPAPGDDIGQGPRGTPREAFDFSQALRDAVG